MGFYLVVCYSKAVKIWNFHLSFIKTLQNPFDALEVSMQFKKIPGIILYDGISSILENFN